VKQPSCQTFLVLASPLILSCFVRADDRATVNISVKPAQIDFSIGKELMASYHYGPEVAKPYLWPLYGPGGRPMTRAWPMEEKLPRGGSFDHVHQKSLWFCHGDVIADGLQVKQKAKGVQGLDFWAEGKGRGQIVCTEVGAPVVVKDGGRIVTQNEWRMPDGTRLLDEKRTIHFYHLGDANLFVFEIDLGASVAPLTFGDTKEGSFGVRVNDALRSRSGYCWRCRFWPLDRAGR
jgi:Methane oxygenase PmoA